VSCCHEETWSQMKASFASFAHRCSQLNGQSQFPSFQQCDNYKYNLK